jgi:hypothetical protein
MFIGLGVVLLAASLLYQRLRDLVDEGRWEDGSAPAR